MLVLAPSSSSNKDLLYLGRSLCLVRILGQLTQSPARNVVDHDEQRKAVAIHDGVLFPARLENCRPRRLAPQRQRALKQSP